LILCLNVGVKIHVGLNVGVKTHVDVYAGVKIYVGVKVHVGVKTYVDANVGVNKRCENTCWRCEHVRSVKIPGRCAIPEKLNLVFDLQI